MILQNPTRMTFGAALAVAIAGCGGGAELDPPSDTVPAPAPGVEREISISPNRGTTATDVNVHASGFDPGTRVAIGFGPPASEYEIFAHATANARGEVHTTVNVPNWAETGRDYLFVATAPGGDEAISSEFRVTSEGDAGDDPAGRVTVTGTLTDEGVECPALRGEDGRLYTLAGDTGGFDQGDRVTVEGAVAEMSFCMQGTTIQVEAIRDAG